MQQFQLALRPGPGGISQSFVERLVPRSNLLSAHPPLSEESRLLPSLYAGSRGSAYGRRPGREWHPIPVSPPQPGGPPLCFAVPRSVGESMRLLGPGPASGRSPTEIQLVDEGTAQCSFGLLVLPSGRLCAHLPPSEGSPISRPLFFGSQGSACGQCLGCGEFRRLGAPPRPGGPSPCSFALPGS